MTPPMKCTLTTDSTNAIPSMISQSPTAAAVPSSPSSPKRTFYRRPLPESTCTALSSNKGKLLFSSAMQNGGLEAFFPLMEQHLTQSEPAYCGISTLVIALNALAIDPRRAWRGPWRWYEESMLNCCVDLEEVKTTGITVSTFKCLAVCQGLHADATYADNKQFHENDGDEANLFESALRSAAIEACMVEPNAQNGSDNKGTAEIQDDVSGNGAQQLKKVLIASYDRKVLGQTGSGHFSPIAAYDPVSDSVLIMDTARFKYGSHWVPLPLLAEAMHSIDPDSGRSRGFIMLSNPVANKNENDGTLPVSILLQSELKSNAARRKFKSYLNRLKTDQSEITVGDVAKFWTKDGTDIDYVWEIAKPQNVPSDDDVCLTESIAVVRSLLMEIIESNEQTKLGIQSSTYGMTERCAANNGCLSGSCRIIPLRPIEVIYVIYLACLDKSTREGIIFSFDTNDIGDDEDARAKRSLSKHQLVAEAELIRYAIDVSDEIDN